MTTIKWIVVVLTLAGAVTGMLAAWYWFKSSRVPIQPSWRTEPGDAQVSQMGWMTETMNAFTEVAAIEMVTSLPTPTACTLDGWYRACNSRE